ncbi:brain acid soluble protein 1 isoform X3 [Brachyistius frenatus]|uniref:brain acid soluble protein 1 isoform X3 n=1 Tax=Brachyistius frenatus TaxID=100188 RepID=UPI0037E9AC69
MFSCRAAWQTFGPLARRAAYRCPRDAVQRRPMSSIPGGSGENIVYTVLCGGAFVGALSYAYSTLSSDSARFDDRIAEIKARPKTEWTPKPWPPKKEEEEEGAAAEEAEEAGGEAELGEAEIVVEVVAEAVAEASQEVEMVAEEVVRVAEAVEEAAEEPESNVLAAASTLEGPKTAPKTAEVDVVKHEEPAAPTEAKPGEETTPAPAPAVEEEAPAPAVEEEAPAPAVEEEAPAPAVEEEAPAPAVKEEAPAPAVEEPPPAVEEEAPVVEETLVPVEPDATTASAEEPVTTTVVEEAVATLVDIQKVEPKREYIVVVLEGTPKEDKRPKVLGVGHMTGRIIPAPEDDDAASEGRRRLLRMQMQ